MTALPISVASSLLCVCVCMRACALQRACLSGHWSRCGYCTISTTGLGSIAFPELLPVHHSMTPPLTHPPTPLCRPPGEQRLMMSFPSQGCLRGSWNTVPRCHANPSRLLVEPSTDKSKPSFFVMCGCACAFSLRVCVIMLRIGPE